MHVVYERCAAIDVGKDEIAVAVRMPGDGPDGRVTVKRTFKTFYGVLGEAARWLVSLGVTHVAMEATGSYSLPVYYALLEHGDFAKMLICNAGHVKNAHLFIDFMLRPEIAAKNSNFVSFANSNAASWPLVNAEVKNNPGIFPTPEMMPKLVPDLPETPEFTRTLTRTWTRFRTGK